MKCSKCGTENPEGKSVCKKCGAFLYSSNPKNRRPLTPEQRKSQRKARAKGNALGCLWTFLVVAGTFIVLGIIVYILVAFVLPPDFFDYISPTTTVTDTLSTTTASVPSATP
jgi:uncharacterized membrane protein YvbJ